MTIGDLRNTAGVIAECDPAAIDAWRRYTGIGIDAERLC